MNSVNRVFQLRFFSTAMLQLSTKSPFLVENPSFEWEARLRHAYHTVTSLISSCFDLRVLIIRLGLLSLTMDISLLTLTSVKSNTQVCSLHSLLFSSVVHSLCAEELNKTLKLIPGVVETGLFVRMASKAFFGYPDGSLKTRAAPGPVDPRKGF